MSDDMILYHKLANGKRKSSETVSALNHTGAIFYFQLSSVSVITLC